MRGLVGVLKLTYVCACKRVLSLPVTDTCKLARPACQRRRAFSIMSVIGESEKYDVAVSRPHLRIEHCSTGNGVCVIGNVSTIIFFNHPNAGVVICSHNPGGHTVQ